VRLVIESAFLAKGGEVFVTKMPVIRIKDLAQVMIEDLAPRYGFDPMDIKIEIIGSKPGEKFYEELMTDEETRRTIELKKYFSIIPAFLSIHKDVDYTYPEMLSPKVTRPYHSGNETPLTCDKLKTFLFENNLLEGELEKDYKPSKRYWGDEKKQH